jgi:hypothetical protein
MLSTVSEPPPMPSPLPPIAEDVPCPDHLTPYDDAHFATYMQLLDAEAAGASPADMARIVLGIDPAKEPARAARMLDSHLRRARWMTTQGCRHLLQR